MYKRQSEDSTFLRFRFCGRRGAGGRRSRGAFGARSLFGARAAGTFTVHARVAFDFFGCTLGAARGSGGGGAPGAFANAVFARSTRWKAAAASGSGFLSG